MSKQEGEEYLGDGLYASFDGWQVKLRAPREGGDHEVFLDDHVLQHFLGWLRRIRAPQTEESP